MVQVIVVDERNAVVQKYSAEVTLPGEVIVLNPGVPQLGSTDFDQWLAKWNKENNPQFEMMA